MNRSYRNTASFGKRQEFTVIARLMQEGFDVYSTLVDDQGIDCIIRFGNHLYLDIQIKARSKDAQQWNFFAAMTFEPRDDYYFIFYTEYDDNIWVIPSNDLDEICYINKSGKNVGKKHLYIPKTSKSEKGQLFEKYKNENGIDLIRQYQLIGVD